MSFFFLPREYTRAAWSAVCSELCSRTPIGHRALPSQSLGQCQSSPVLMVTPVQCTYSIQYSYTAVSQSQYTTGSSSSISTSTCTVYQYTTSSFHFTVRPGPLPSVCVAPEPVHCVLGVNRQRTTAGRRRTYEAQFSFSFNGPTCQPVLSGGRR